MAALVAHTQDALSSPSRLSPELDSIPAKISAYYSLVFPNFTYYLQTLNVTIGRRCIPASAASSSENPQVDVDLGPLKSVSRLHAKIEYEEEEERFVLIVIGRNGAWVDGVWSGSGSKVPLSDRSQIQIASRTFHFVLPPPPAPEDSPSPSSNSSDNRARSRSPSVDIVDVTSISPPSSLPSCSPPPAPVSPLANKIPPLSEAALPNSNTISKFKSNAKKRKKSDAAPPPPPPPELMPPKPPFTYAQLCYRAIKALEGKASLQDICLWIKETYEWYRYCAKDWESSVRHNLSSNPGFKKLLRSKDEKGKGALWTVDEAFEHNFEEQDARRQAQVAAAATGTGGKDGKVAGKKGKTVVPLEPPFKRSVKGDVKGPLPPPLTSTPLTLKTNSTTTPSLGLSSLSAAASLHSSISPPLMLETPVSVKFEAPAVKLEPLGASFVPSSVHSTSPASGQSAQSPPPGVGSTSHAPEASSSSSIPPTSAFPAIPATVRIPIVVGPVPTQPSDAPSSPPKPIVLHDNTLILNPEIFSHLTPDHLKDLEALGAQKALEILQSYIVRYYKEKLKSEGGRGRGRGRPRRGRGGIGGRGATPSSAPRTDTPTSGPFTTTPLPPRSAQPSPQTASNSPESTAQLGSRAGVPAPAPPMGSLRPPVDSAPSPILVIDDDSPDSDEGPSSKRRRLEGAGTGDVS
ncbi:hypothetical protein IEO21_02873 [Rhodonia placenta]|uniref:Uncharacterized protein n=1 Tax=Rhodonia placenta TaxID=104341 RepID=A0A8H7U442_9APHY|nr:hypothetical protein IEO21_02873 [Postia placenta]